MVELPEMPVAESMLQAKPRGRIHGDLIVWSAVCVCARPDDEVPARMKDLSNAGE